eukprot:3139940-Prymnesium_polylepis.1
MLYLFTHILSRLGRAHAAEVPSSPTPAGSVTAFYHVMAAQHLVPDRWCAWPCTRRGKVARQV